jgi:putative GTP pyrophosphokinase
MAINKIATEFKSSRPQYEAFTLKIQTLIKELLVVEKIRYHLVDGRTKELSSLEHKLKRKRYSTLNEITDLSACRIIVYYHEDIERIIDKLQDEFTIDSANSVTKGEEFNPNEFGYKSFHVVLNVSEDRGKLSEWKSFKNFKCEIQIRTVLQHAWAAISHALQYKAKQDVPKELQRKLFRLAGLFELADEQFSEINEQHAALLGKAKAEDIEQSGANLDLITLNELLKRAKVIDKIYSIALKVGFSDTDTSPYEFEEDQVESESETISRLLQICELMGIRTAKDLIKDLKKRTLKDLTNYLTNQITDRENDDTWYASKAFIIILVLLYLHPEAISAEILINKFEWGKKVAYRTIKVAKELSS